MPPIDIKRLPDDFQVDEITSLQPGGGEFSLYRLSKRSLTTLEAVERIARSWNLPPAAIQYAGMKDRHAITHQYITIQRGPREPMNLDTASLEYLGQAPRGIGPGDIVANRFAITLRNFTENAIPVIETAIDELQRYHVPNYFDDQRFRSLGPSREFIARAWCEDHYERALWLALAEENDSDRADEKQQKRALRDGWGRWAEVKEKLERSHRRSIVTYLADHPTDFRRAFERVRVEFRRIYISAFQSFLWNRFAASRFAAAIPAGDEIFITSGFGEFPAYRRLSNDLLQYFGKLMVPLPSSRTRFRDPEVERAFDASLAEIGLSLKGLRVKHGRDAFFAVSERPVLLRAGTLVHGVGDDDLHPGRKCLRLSFELPRGSYATIITKRILAPLKGR